MISFFTVCLSTYQKNRISILRAVPWSFLISRILTGVMQILFPFFLWRYFMQGNLSADFTSFTGSSDYLTYIALGSALNVLAVATLMNVGRALITELREGTLEVLLLSPMSRSGYFCGCLAEQTIRALLEFAAVLLTGACLGARLGGLLRLDALLVILLAVFAFFCMGLSLSSVMLRTRDTYISQNTLFNAMSLVCGILFPIQYLPVWVQRFAQIFPLTPVVQLFREIVLNGRGLADCPELILQTLLLSLLYLSIGAASFRCMERTLIENIFA